MCCNSRPVLKVKKKLKYVKPVIKQSASTQATSSRLS